MKSSTTNAFRLVLASGLLAGVSAYAQAAPDWSAYIGAGRAASFHEITARVTAPLTSAAARSSTPDWSAFIGTGQVSADSDRRSKEPQTSSDAALRSATHWSAKIGNGHAFDADSQRVSRTAAVPAVSIIRPKAPR
jgi:hypothetical protein